MNVEALNSVATFSECVWEPDDILELRLLKKDADPKSYWHRAKDIEHQAEALAGMNANGFNIYVGANPRRQHGGSTAEDVAIAHCLFCDWDGGCTEEEARAKIIEAELPAPTVLLASGGGIHAYWRMLEPITDLAEFTRFQKRIIAATGADGSIHDPPRIMRLPGFFNRKPKYETPPMCRILEADPSRRWTLQEIVGHLPDVGTVPKPAPTNGSPAPSGLTEYARAAAYVCKIPGAVHGERNQAAFRVAAVLVKDFNLDIGQARWLLGSWNQANVPPLDDAELDDVLRSARQYGNHQPGQKLNEQRKDYKQNGHTLPIGNKSADELHREPVEYKLLTCADLDAGTFDVAYLIYSIMAACQPMIVAALQKTLKTSIALDMAIALATAGYFLGFFKVPRKVGVVFMSGESGMSAIKRTAQSICEAAGIDLAGIDNLWFSSQLPRIGHLEHMDALKAMLLKTGAKVLFLDPVYLCMPATDNGNIFATGELLRAISDLCQELGVTLVLIHHLKRSAATKDGPPELSDLQWSGYAEWARQWVLIRRREPYEDGQPHRLELYAGGSEGHGAHVAVDIDQGQFDPAKPRKWDVLVQSAGEAKEAVSKRTTEAKAEQNQKRLRADVLAIEEAAKKFPEGETKTVIRDAAGLNTNRMNPALAIALKEHRVAPCMVLKSNWRKAIEGFKPYQSDQSDKQSDQSGNPSGDHSVGQPCFPLGEQCPTGGLGAEAGEQSE